MEGKTRTLEKLLNKYSVTKERYLSEKKALTKLGYNEEDCNKLIFRKASKNSVRSVIANHAALKISFSRTQIVRVANHSGGCNNIKSLKIRIMN